MYCFTIDIEIMTDPDRVKLLFGLYRSPALRRGDRAHCLFRDCLVVVTSWTDAPIPWPRCRIVGGSGGPHSIAQKAHIQTRSHHEPTCRLPERAADPGDGFSTFCFGRILRPPPRRQYRLRGWRARRVRARRDTKAQGNQDDSRGVGFSWKPPAASAMLPCLTALSPTVLRILPVVSFRVSSIAKLYQ